MYVYIYIDTSVPSVLFSWKNRDGFFRNRMANRGLPDLWVQCFSLVERWDLIGKLVISSCWNSESWVISLESRILRWVGDHLMTTSKNMPGEIPRIQAWGKFDKNWRYGPIIKLRIFDDVVYAAGCAFLVHGPGGGKGSGARVESGWTWGLCWSRHCGYSESNSRQAHTQGGKPVAPWRVFWKPDVGKESSVGKIGKVEESTLITHLEAATYLLAPKKLNLVGLSSAKFSHLWEELQYNIL